MVDENRIKENLKAFSFHRLSGTEGEKKALNLAIQRVKELNLNPSTQDFEFSTYFGRIYPKLAFLLGFMALFLFYINLAVFMTHLLLVIIGLILGFLFILARKPESIRLPMVLNLVIFTLNLIVNLM